MNILILTRTGRALGLAHKLAIENNRVVVYSPQSSNIVNSGKGLYKLTDNLWKAVEECKFIITDGGNWSDVYNRAAIYNKPIIGSNIHTDILNNDYVKEYDLARRFKLPYPETEIMEDSLGIFEKIMSWDKSRYFIKYDRTSFRCEYNEFAAWMMYKVPVGKAIILQQEVTGLKIDVQGWFDGMYWVEPFMLVGADSSSVGVSLMVRDNKSILAETFKKLKPWLTSIDYHGPVTAKLIVNQDEAFVIGLFVGFTYPDIYAVCEGLKIEIGYFLNGIAFSSGQSVDITRDIITAVDVVATSNDMFGAPILGLGKENIDHVFLNSVYKDEDSYLISGDTPNIYTVAARGRSISEVSQRVSRTLKTVKFPNMRYEDRISNLYRNTFQKLNNWKYIDGRL